MKILVTGRSGQVGMELQRSLLPLGEIIAAGRNELDLEDTKSIGSILDEMAPDIIVNAAAYTAVDKAESEESIAHSVNVKSVIELAAYAARSRALLIQYSTDYVFDGEKQGAYYPKDKPNPQSVYGRTKLGGERVITAAAPDHLILRTSWIYSQYGHNFVKTMLRLASSKDELRVVSDQVGAPTSAELIADVTALAIVGHRNGLLGNGVYHLTASGETSWHGFAKHVINRARLRGADLAMTEDEVEPILTSEYPTLAKRPLNSCLNTASLSEALKLELPNWTVHANRVIDQLVQKA